MLKRLGSSIAICLLTFVHIVSAQTETPDTFPVEQRCITAPTQPPSDWTYPGMILMSGYAGIHAMQADWQTPRVVASFGRDVQGNIPLSGGQLSPDENWYAIPIGITYEDPPTFHYVSVRKIRLYSLSGDGEIFDRDPSDQDQYIAFGLAFTYYPVQWRDNESLMIAGSLLRPFAGTAEANPFQFSAVGRPLIFSPDLTRTFGTQNSAFYSNGSTYFGLFDPFDPEKFHKPLSGVYPGYWRHDSSGFMAYSHTENYINHGLDFYNRDGELLDQVFDLGATGFNPTPPISGRTDLQWSPDDRYFGFVVDPYVPKELYLVDMQERVVIDTCLTAVAQPVWSPDGTMFAYLANAPQNLNLVVVDMTTWRAYVVARHSGRQPYLNPYPEMVGWRSITQAQ